MNYATIKWTDIANGEGVRISLFVSGCTHRCKNCFNEVAWDFTYGDLFDEDVENKIISELKYDYIAGLSLLGGEPLEPQNQKALYPFIKRARAAQAKRAIPRLPYSPFRFYSLPMIEERREMNFSAATSGASSLSK